MGLLQLMPGTARELHCADPMNPEQNIKAGTLYLSQLWHRIKAKWPTIADDDSLRMALAAYNGGLGYVLAAAKGVSSPPTWPAIAEALRTVTFNGKRPDHKQMTDYVARIMPS